MEGLSEKDFEMLLKAAQETLIELAEEFTQVIEILIMVDKNDIINHEIRLCTCDSWEEYIERLKKGEFLPNKAKNYTTKQFKSKALTSFEIDCLPDVTNFMLSYTFKNGVIVRDYRKNKI